MKRFAILFSVFVMTVLTPSIPVASQAGNCYQLSQSDCQLLGTAFNNFRQLTSFTYSFTFNSSLITAKPAQSARLSVSGSGEAAYKAQSSDIVHDLNVSLRFALPISGSPSTIQGILLNGVIYFDTGSPDSIGIDMSDIGRSAVVGTFFTPDALKAIGSLPSVKGFITVERSANKPVLDGQEQAEFVYSLDMRWFASSREALTLIKTAIRTAQSLGYKGRFNDLQLRLAQPILSRVLRNTTIHITQWVGLNDQMLHRLSIEVNAQIDPGELFIRKQPEFTATGSLTITLNDIGKPVTITAPRRTKVVAFETIIQRLAKRLFQETASTGS
jgi:hypothetical protein